MDVKKHLIYYHATVNLFSRYVLNLYGLRTFVPKTFMTQQHIVNGQRSKAQVISHGVPQGLTVGPLLILVYINDVPNCLNPLKPNRDLSQTSHCNIKGLSVSEVIRILLIF